MEELVEDQEFDQVRYTKIFAGGTMRKMLKCPGCQKEKRLTDSVWVLQVKDTHFELKNQEFYFQTDKEIRECGYCKQKGTFNVKYLATKLPKILAIRIQDTQKSKKRVEILPEILLNEGSKFYFKEESLLKTLWDR